MRQGVLSSRSSGSSSLNDSFSSAKSSLDSETTPEDFGHSLCQNCFVRSGIPQIAGFQEQRCVSMADYISSSPHPQPESAPAFLSPLCFCLCTDAADRSTPVFQSTAFFSYRQWTSSTEHQEALAAGLAPTVQLVFVTTTNSNHHCPKRAADTNLFHLLRERVTGLLVPNTAWSGVPPHPVFVAFFCCTHIASAKFA